MIERWLVAIRDHPNRPPLAQSHVLWCLALRVDWHTGRGFASVQMLAADSGVEERTVRRATKWGRDTGFVLRTRRGHRINAETSIASEWCLTLPSYPQAESQPDTGDLLANPTGQNGQPNRTLEAPNRTPAQHHQESSVLQKSSSSTRASREQDQYPHSNACRSGGRYHSDCAYDWCWCACHRTRRPRESTGDRALREAEALKADLSTPEGTQRRQQELANALTAWQAEHEEPFASLAVTGAPS